MGEAIKTRRGKAKDSKLLLYKEGDEYIDNSGGWFPIIEGVGAVNGSCIKDVGDLRLVTIAASGAGSGHYPQWYTADKIDLTRFKTLKVRATITSSNDNVVVHFATNSQQSYVSGTKSATKYINTTGTDITYSLDITSVTSTDFIMLMATGGLNGEIVYQATVTIYEVWLEE